MVYSGQGKAYLNKNQLRSWANDGRVSKEQFLIKQIAFDIYDRFCLEGSECHEKILAEYQATKNPNYEPWCVQFPWWVQKEAERCGGLKNLFPNRKSSVIIGGKRTQVWGNAERTKQFLIQKNVRRSTRNPEVGDIFYRFSADQNASGHMGIVLNVSPSGIWTIEGNVKIDGGDGVGSWYYPSRDYRGGTSKTGFIFFKTWNVSSNLIGNLEYKDGNCKSIKNTVPDVSEYESSKKEKLPACIKAEKPSKTSVYNYTYTDPKTGKKYPAKKSGDKFRALTDTYGSVLQFTDVTNCNSVEPKEIVKEFNEDPNIPADNPPEYVKKACDQVIFSIPKAEFTPYWRDVFRNKYFWADILGANNVDKQTRNGYALGYVKRDQDLSKPSGIGFMRTKMGRPIYVTYAGSEAYDMLFGEDSEILNGKNNFLGKYEEYVIYKGRDNDTEGSGWKEKYTDKAVNNPDRRQRGNIKGGSLIVKKPTNYSDRVGGSYYLRLQSLLESIDETPLENTEPIALVIVISYQPPANNRMNQAMGYFSTFTQIAGTFVPGFGAVAPILNKVVNLATNLSTGRRTSVEIKNIIEIASVLAPAGLVNKIEDNWNDLEKTATNWFKIGENTFNELMQGNLTRASQLLGVDSSTITKIENQYNQLKGFINVDLTKFAGKKLEDLTKEVFNLDNMLLTDQMIRSGNKEGSLAQQIQDNRFVMDVPLIRKMFVNGAADTILPVLPNKENIINSIIKSLDRDEFNRPNAHSRNAFLSMALGVKAPKEVLAEYNLRALTEDAISKAKEKIPFVLPPSIKEEEADCYKVIIKQNAGIRDEDVIVCRDGWTYDHRAKKCKRDNAFISFDSDKKKDSFGTNIPNTGGLDLNNKNVKVNPINIKPKGNNSGINKDRIDRMPFDPLPFDPKLFNDDSVDAPFVPIDKAPKDNYLPVDKTPIDSFLPIDTAKNNPFVPIDKAPKDNYLPVDKTPIESFDPIDTKKIDQFVPIDEAPDNPYSPKKENSDCEDDIKNLEKEIRRLKSLNNSNDERTKRIIRENEEYKTALESTQRALTEARKNKNNDTSLLEKRIIDLQREINNYKSDIANRDRIIKELQNNPSDTAKINELRSELRKIQNEKISLVNQLKANNKNDKDTEKIVELYNRKNEEYNQLKELYEDCKNRPEEVAKKSYGCTDCDLARLPSYTEKTERIYYGGHEESHNSECEEC